MTLCVSLTFLVSTIIYYNYYIGVEKTQAFRSDLHDLTQTSKEVVNMNEAAQSPSFQTYRTSTISKIVFYDKPDIFDVTSAMSELGNYLTPYLISSPSMSIIPRALSCTSLPPMARTVCRSLRLKKPAGSATKSKETPRGILSASMPASIR